MTYSDAYGENIDAATLERAAVATLKAWIAVHLAAQEERNGLTRRSLPLPRSWPTVSAFDPEPHEQLPSIVLVSPGTTGDPLRSGDGTVAATWRLEIVVAVAGRDEPETRWIAAMYAAAVRSALVQNGELGGIALQTHWVGEEYAIEAERGTRMMVEIDFETTVDSVVDVSQGPDVPPTDPYATPADPRVPIVGRNVDLTLE